VTTCTARPGIGTTLRHYLRHEDELPRRLARILGRVIARNSMLVSGDDLVRAGGLEPPRGCPQRIFVPATAFAAAEKAFVVWTIPSP